MKFVVSLTAIALVGSVIFVVLLELYVSSGAGNAQDRPQGSKAEQSEQERTDAEKAKEKEEKLEWESGIVAVGGASLERALLVRPDKGERQLFTYRPEKVKITLDGEKVGPDAIDEGQKVIIGYEKVTSKKDRKWNVAKSIELQPKERSPGDESTG
jgi:hypothetical protein